MSDIKCQNREPAANPRKGKKVGPKRPFKSGEIWMTRRALMDSKNKRDLVLLNLGVDSKLRACDLLSLTVNDVMVGQSVKTEATILQQKTRLPVTFEITAKTREAIADWVRHANLEGEDFIFQSRIRNSPHLKIRQYSRIIKRWAAEIDRDPTEYATHSIRRSKATILYEKTHNLRAIQQLLGHQKIENTVRYLGVELSEALKMSREIDV